MITRQEGLCLHVRAFSLCVFSSEIERHSNNTATRRPNLSIKQEIIDVFFASTILSPRVAPCKAPFQLVVSEGQQRQSWKNYGKSSRWLVGSVLRVNLTLTRHLLAHCHQVFAAGFAATTLCSVWFWKWLATHTCQINQREREWNSAEMNLFQRARSNQRVCRLQSRLSAQTRAAAP